MTQCVLIKKERVVFLDVVTIGGNIVGIENNTNNINIHFLWVDILKRIFRRLANLSIFIDRCWVDCSSFSEEIIFMVYGSVINSMHMTADINLFYKKATYVTDWGKIGISFEDYQVIYITFISFLKEGNYQLVIQR